MCIDKNCKLRVKLSSAQNFFSLCVSYVGKTPCQGCLFKAMLSMGENLLKMIIFLGLY